MAQKIQTILISDLSGIEIAPGGGESIDFSYRGVEYSIDVTTKEAEKFDAAMSFYIDHGTRTGGRAKRSAGTGSKGQARGKQELQAVREWARANGHSVSDRGRISAQVQKAYDAANR